MVTVVKKYKLEVLHVHYAIPHAYAAFMAKQILREQQINIPVVTTLHGTDITLVGRNPSYLPAVNFSINHSDVVSSVSESLKKDTLAFFDIKKEIEVIPNFLDLSLYQTEKPCKQQFSKQGEKVITHISNFRKVKRLPDVVKIFAQIQAQIPSVLLLLGDGPEKEKVRQLSYELGIASKVKFLGKTSEIERVLCISDLFILPSEKESFGLAALEAMGAGVPVISSNTGGLPEVNLHEVTGYTAEVGAVDQLADYGIQILQDEAVHQRFSQQARVQAERFSIEVVGPQYLNLYQKAIALKNA
jgi:N-acetyl-alpha-D-glucosaminyl L-malate synthase BshA